MNTGENEQGLRTIIDFTRLMSVAVLVIHLYIFCYSTFQSLELTAESVEKVLVNVYKTGWFTGWLKPKSIALAMLVVSLVGAKGKKEESISLNKSLVVIATGLVLYFTSIVIHSKEQSDQVSYMVMTVVGYLLILMGGTWLSRLIRIKFTKDIFNKLNESFPQEERLIKNEYSINLPARYNLKGRIRKSWINIINPFRGLLVIGTPGAGKSYFVIRHIIAQHIRKGFTMFLYDFKFDDLSKIAYNTLLSCPSTTYKVKLKFYVINFEDLSRSHRCNPLDPATMEDITDAAEASRIIMLSLNREWIKRQGDFFVESPVNLVTAMIWFLRKYEDGRYCTLPHTIELMQLEYKELFDVLRTEPEIAVLINPFENAFKNEAFEQLEGQMAAAKLTLGKLASPRLYYILSGNDFTLDVNNPNEPKIVCAGNNPQKQQVYGAVLSLYISRMLRLVNRKGQQKCSLVFDEFPTIYFNGMDSLIATARSNKVATTLAVQDYSQLKKDYGREQAEVIMNIVGNVISGQAVGDTAKLLSERFGKIIQQRESISINRTDTSLSRSTQLEAAIPPSTIATLSSGEFVGMVADDPENKIALKVFHNEIINNHKAIAREEADYKPIPVIRRVTHYEIQENYLKIKQDILDIADSILKQ